MERGSFVRARGRGVGRGRKGRDTHDLLLSQLANCPWPWSSFTCGALLLTAGSLRIWRVSAGPITRLAPVSTFPEPNRVPVPAFQGEQALHGRLLARWSSGDAKFQRTPPPVSIRILAYDEVELHRIVLNLPESKPTKQQSAYFAGHGALPVPEHAPTPSEPRAQDHVP